MSTLTMSPPRFLRAVTKIARTVAHGHRGTHRARLAGTVGTSNTVLVAHSAQRGLGGKHRAVSA